MAINFSERDSCSPGWRAPEHTSNSQPRPFQKGKIFSPEFFQAQAELEGALFLCWALVGDGRMARIFAAVWLDSCCSRLLSTPHRDSYPDAEAQP